MSPDLILTLAVILPPIAAVAAYMAWADVRERRAARVATPFENADILVNGAFRPARLVLAGGRPLRLRFTRAEDDESWWDDLEFPYVRIRRTLPEGETITVDIRPLAPGEYAFFCAEGSKRGTLVIADGEES